MIILLLDDQEIRHATAEKYFARDHILYSAFDADEAIDILLSGKSAIGLALLDHDLNDFVSAESGSSVPYEYSGRKIEKHGVYFLNRMFADVPKDRYPAQFVIHSYNQVGAKNMYDKLIEMRQVATILPFSGDNLRLVVDRIKSQ
jgi:hypothetical protein